MIGILSIGMGNLRSIENAVSQQGFDPHVAATAGGFDDFSHLILPGVGQFTTAMHHVIDCGLLEPVRTFAASGRPVLGICLGMQLLATTGSEGGESAGIDLVPGVVRRLPSANGLRIPHVGWNSVILRRPHPVLDGLKPNRDFYFVHSYAFHSADSTDVLAETDYGALFESIVGRGNVIGLQFHPEKSQSNGLRLIENFCNWDGAC